MSQMGCIWVVCRIQQLKLSSLNFGLLIKAKCCFGLIFGSALWLGFTKDISLLPVSKRNFKAHNYVTNFSHVYPFPSLVMNILEGASLMSVLLNEHRTFGLLFQTGSGSLKIPKLKENREEELTHLTYKDWNQKHNPKQAQ